MLFLSCVVWFAVVVKKRCMAVVVIDASRCMLLCVVLRVLLMLGVLL